MPTTHPALTRRGLMAGTLTAPALAGAAPHCDTPDPAAAARAALADAKGTRLVILGTAAGPIPRLPRHMTSHVMVSNAAAYVLDCGLGVTNQFVRTGLKFGQVRSIFLTHHHADHNIEYGPFLVIGWVNGLPLGVRAYGPPPLAQLTEDFLRAYRTTIDFWADDLQIPALHAIDVREGAGGPVMADENVRVTSIRVHHPPVTPALAYRFDFADRSIAFSGDTTPLPAVAVMARGADVLVHEAWLPAADEISVRASIAEGARADAERLMAHMRASHTPVEEVGRIAAAAGVRTLVLSHLAPARPIITDDEWRAPAAKHFKGQILVAHDLMVV